MANYPVKSTFENLIELASEKLPLKIRFKDKSKVMKILNSLIGWFAKDFMTRFTTTWGYTIYFPSEAYIKENPQLATRILAHELVHLLDAQKHGKALFTFAYALPQILFLGIFSFPWLEAWAILFLVFLLPLPAPFRYYFESRGYAVSMMTHPQKTDNPIPYLSYFTGWIYYKMFPFPKKVTQKILEWRTKTEQNQAPILQKVMKWYEEAIRESK